LLLREELPVRLLVVLATALCARSTITAQSDLWHHTSLVLLTGKPNIERQIQSVTLPQSQQQSIVRLLKASVDTWTCGTDDPTGEWLNDLHYGTIPISPTVNVFLVEAGPGCARGGQGSNGAMWLVRFDGLRSTVLASPQQDFSGWIYSVEPTTFNGYRDIIVGWHMGAFETQLGYFRFDGKAYRRISSATLNTDDAGKSKIKRRN
jgi:hypothetical protein